MYVLVSVDCFRYAVRRQTDHAQQHKTGILTRYDTLVSVVSTETGETMARKALLVRVDEETYQQLEEIMKRQRWGPQVLGEVMIEHYLKSVEAAKKAAAKQAQPQSNGK